ncbi:hypothetical protein Y032_0009g497 [Ancylostoma ceylanicum]|uniref:Secreted protein n=1 Tax=Ancylostoma ceylanicum TaxID=53326 RepID=A0A016VHL0_9BILA|nr:hypothetical protein Y032_0009g497 [Ancylostoma ceylanicum]
MYENVTKVLIFALIDCASQCIAQQWLSTQSKTSPNITNQSAASRRSVSDPCATLPLGKLTSKKITVSFAALRG